MDIFIRDGSLKIFIFSNYYMTILFEDLGNGNNYRKLC